DEKSPSPSLRRMLASLTIEIDKAIQRIGFESPRPRIKVPPKSAVLCLDTRSMRVFYKGEEIKTTPTTFRLLNALAQSPHEPMTYEDLLSKASKYDGEIFSLPATWAKNHKLALMKSLRSAVDGSKITSKEIEQLIVSRNGCMALKLAAEDIAIL
ncbi:MAG: hypothetical protein ABIJ00_07670, partial [Candidatus Eisenbacteria bacterium]